MYSSRMYGDRYTVDQEYYDLIKDEGGIKFSAIVSRYLFNEDGSVSNHSIDVDSTMGNNHQPFNNSKDLDNWIKILDNVRNIFYILVCSYETAKDLGLGKEYIIANVDGKNFLLRFGCNDSLELCTERHNSRSKDGIVWDEDMEVKYCWEYTFHYSGFSPKVIEDLKKLPRVYGKFETVHGSYKALQELVS